MMKKILIIALVMLGWCGHSSISSADGTLTPVLALRIRQGEGYSYTAFALYDSGDIIFQQPEQPPGYVYSHVLLTSSEFEQFLHHVPTPEALYALDARYNLPQKIVHGEVMQFFYIQLAEKPTYISVYGNIKRFPLEEKVDTLYRALQGKCPSSSYTLPIETHLRKARFEVSQAPGPPTHTTVCGVSVAVSDIHLSLRAGIGVLEEIDVYRERCPMTLRNLFDLLIAYDHPRAVPWLPDKIEVIIRPCVDESHEGDIEWPAIWPDLDAPTTKNWNDGSGRYSLFLDSQDFEKLQRYIGFGESINLDGRRWIASWRLPLPGEYAWREGWGKHQ